MPVKLVRQGRASARDRNARRAAILDAALDEFAAHGFAATRLDDVARRADIAKGTIYLYFRDKEALFHALVRTLASPIIARIAALPESDMPVRQIAQAIAQTFVRDIFLTRRKEVLRLILTEGQRFPHLAGFYYREVIGRVLPPLRKRLRRAAETGELASDGLARFPQLLVAPALLAILWNGLFERFAPLDVEALMQAHLESLFGKEPRR